MDRRDCRGERRATHLSVHDLNLSESRARSNRSRGVPSSGLSSANSRRPVISPLTPTGSRGVIVAGNRSISPPTGPAACTAKSSLSDCPRSNDPSNPPRT